MTQELPPPITFDPLRIVGLEAAQAASGGIWTDYNVHDPGVTLLEQTCFALTEISYQFDHKVRDLLTDDAGGLDFAGLALPPPTEVLPALPVSQRDFEILLSALPEVSSLRISDLQKRGLWSIFVVPAEEVSADAAETAVRNAFRSVRPLCIDLDAVNVVSGV